MAKFSKLLILIALVCMINGACAMPYDIVRENKDAWECVDYAVTFARDNPEWGCVVLSNNVWFLGENHLVNYKYDKETDTLYLLDTMPNEDPMYNEEMKYSNFIEGQKQLTHDSSISGSGMLFDYENSCVFFHFYTDESQILRRGYSIRDNTQMIIADN